MIAIEPSGASQARQSKDVIRDTALLNWCYSVGPRGMVALWVAKTDAWLQCAQVAWVEFIWERHTVTAPPGHHIVHAKSGQSGPKLIVTLEASRSGDDREPEPWGISIDFKQGSACTYRDGDDGDWDDDSRVAGFEELWHSFKANPRAALVDERTAARLGTYRFEPMPGPA